jgi:hypothetical protein
MISKIRETRCLEKRIVLCGGGGSGDVAVVMWQWWRCGGGGDVAEVVMWRW